MTRNLKYIITGIIIVFATISCTKEKLEMTYTNQEAKIDQYINSNKYTDSSKTDSLRVVYNNGSTRLVLTEGTGEELNGNGTAAIYYAGYVFNGSKTNGNLFITNHEETAKSAGWELKDENFDIYKFNMSDTRFIEGLKNGLMGVKGGEHCQILFSGKYGFGNEVFGIIPANSALLYEIWVEAISND
jgi:FKBP-type peptidyl-prolyl cis-trans isomerase